VAAQAPRRLKTGTTPITYGQALLLVLGLTGRPVPLQGRLSLEKHAGFKMKGLLSNVQQPVFLPTMAPVRAYLALTYSLRTR
jgi:hypothetical protein